MSDFEQLPLLNDISSPSAELKAERSGSFVDNMSQPVHRWFRYSAGFSAEWVAHVIREWSLGSKQTILDPFSGSGTVALACQQADVNAIGIEAHAMVSRIARTKLQWSTSPNQFSDFVDQVISDAGTVGSIDFEYPDLIQRSFSPEWLARLHALRIAWEKNAEDSAASNLTWLALTAILRPVSSAGTAQWQYILPNKTKKQVTHPDVAFRRQVETMLSDMRWMQSRPVHTNAQIFDGDARASSTIMAANSIDGVITSPPYANNYDYADALRFEMTFWGEVSSWGDIHEAVRKHLIVSSSQHASKEKYELDEILASPAVEPIRKELSGVTQKLAVVREDHGGKKHYHTMVAAYCRDISLTVQQLRTVCRPGAKMCWVIGDSAPYGIYCPIDKWIGELSIAAGFKQFAFEKLRDRNIKWKNRKHRVPLKEGLLWIEG